ncbi:hypothetical protein EW146_g5992 [Bondarzewia mesenterica]|uniref:DNA polymerase alpha/delta/epsilon subunit B domain-containing protein n=1 Tax=Bondarzewia mesenterica TaxID=1095465 RepID=A0A4S4LPV5_9AGAM|nr:hypothetical protein EW146_g5992 [Bondarzewia mesenterica]
MSSLTPIPTPSSSLIRIPTTVLPLIDKTPSFVINAANKSFKHQYANIYFVRLRLLRDFVEKEARRRWKDVAEDIGRDHSIPAPPPREKIYSSDDVITLEDESGRIQLTNSGEFEVVDFCFAGMAPQDEDEDADDGMDVDEKAEAQSSNVSEQTEEYVAFVSGLDIGSPTPSEAQIQILVEYLTGEGGGSDDQVIASQISRLIILGNSLAPVNGPGANPEEAEKEKEKEKKPRRYGYDSTYFSPHPALNLSAHLHDLSRSMPVHLLPGSTDPSGTILPQQPIPRAMFGGASTYATFSCETNPTYLRLASGLDTSEAEGRSKKRSRTILATSGQPLDDMFKYLPSPPMTRLKLAESTLRWRHMAPTAPDTLWCHPYFTTDPFVLTQTPDIYVIGCQPRFSTRLVKQGSKQCRIVLVPKFAETGVLVLVGLKMLDVRIVKFSVEGMSVGTSAESILCNYQPLLSGAILKEGSFQPERDPAFSTSMPEGIAVCSCYYLRARLDGPAIVDLVKFLRKRVRIPPHMMFTTVLTSLLLPIVVSAQVYGPAPGGGGSPATSSSASAAVPSAPPSTSSQINVDVAAGGSFVFNPSNFTASNGTLVTFFFPSGSIAHSVTQSSFAEPCTYLAAANGSSGGFDSGLQTGVQFTVNITDDTKPIWFHCKQVTHCGLGMVGSINAPSAGNTFDAFKAAALNIGSNEAQESDIGPVTGGVGAIATAAPAATASGSSSGSGSGSSSGSSDATRIAASSALALISVAVAFAFA